ncbi:MAG: TonB-dependent receptor, partial [Cytophagales bacterium]|nr:TonB-dependent receptor [Cytophagales bacterium]
LYADRFANALYAFDDRTYTTQDRPSSFGSFYKDDTQGAILEYGHAFGSAHALKATAQYKHDRHRENNLGEPRRTTRDQTLSVGVEDVYQLSPKLSVLPGLGFNHRRSLRADHYQAAAGETTAFPASRNGALNAQVAVHYAPAGRHFLHASVARKSRFPTIKDRYSYRLGMALPNPGLKAEWATHYEAGYRGATAGGITLQTSVFLSHLTDVIQQVNEVQPSLFQLQNAGRAVFYGGEFSARSPLLPALQTEVQYSFVQRENRSRPELKFTDVPAHKVFWSAQYDYRQRASLWASFEYNAPRYSTSYGTRASDYGLAHLKASVKLYRFVSLEGGVNNALDKHYALVEGFPEEGRNYFVNLVITHL